MIVSSVLRQEEPTQNEWQCLTVKQLEAWKKDNDFIHFGYRPQLNAGKCLKSILKFHNETGAIWTHLIAGLLFANLAANTFYCNPRKYKNTELLLSMTFLVTSVICFTTSTIYHTFKCYSESTCRLLCKLDYIGITIFIFGSFVPWLYYGFEENFELGKRYITLVGTLAVMCVIVSCMDLFKKPRNRAIRTALFLVYGLSGIFPATHFRIHYCHGIQALSESFNYLCVMGSTHTLGALIYAFRVPERSYPGFCDYWFNSHQIFHLLVVIASLVHYHCIVNLIEFRVQKDPNQSSP